MSSKKNQSGADKNVFGSSGKKSAEEKKKSRKEAYNQKNYKSTSVLPSSTLEKSSLLQYKASSKPSDLDPNPKDDNIKMPFKEKMAGNVRPHNRNVQQPDNLSLLKRNFNPGNAPVQTFTPYKNREDNQRKQPYVPNIVSPHFMAMSSPHQSQVPSASKQPQHIQKVQRGNNQNNFKQSGANPKIFKEPNHDNSLKPVNQSFMRGKYKYTKSVRQPDFQKQVRFTDEPIKDNHQDRGFHFQNNCMGNHQNPPFAKNFTPLINYKEKISHSNNQKSELAKGNTGQSKGRNHRRKKGYCTRKIEYSKDNNVAPLLSFQSISVKPGEGLDLIHFSDEDDFCTNSQSSFDSTANLIDFSDDDSVLASQPPDDDSVLASQPPDDISYPVDISNTSALQLSVDNIAAQSSSDDESNSDSTEESGESDLTSEFSVDSSVLDSETRTSYLRPSNTKEESFISVFWDIENCALPSKKSAVDFASYVRGTFYEGRTEVAFTAACDVKNLNPNFVRELDEAAVTLIHTSSLNKNAADKKIMSLLQKFQNQYRKSNSALVLISSDSDFSQILLDMRYQHHIFVNLICKSNTRGSLITAANNYVFFDNVLNEIPDRDSESDVQHLLIVTNLPKMKFQQIKSSLTEKLKSFNCRIKYENASMIKIIFKDRSVCDQAMVSLRGFYLGGNALDIKYKKELNETEVAATKKNKTPKSFDVNARETDASNIDAKSEITKKSSPSKGATLCVVVSVHIGDVQFWKNVFEKLWKVKDFTILHDNTFGERLLISFKSIKKAQKAKNILQKNQMNDPTAPKFMKLIKQEEDFTNINTNIVSDIEEQNKKKIDEHLQIIEKKKLKFLRKHENTINEMKHQTLSETSSEATEAVNEKIKECQEQIQTFKNFSSIIINTMKLLNRKSEDFEQKLKELLCDFTRECNCIASALPIYAKKEEILRRIREHQVIVIRAETGSGKSTQLTQYIWRDRSNFQNGTIICTQPRKIAAISLAKHVSSQIGTSLGDIVGYQVGMSSKKSANTKILYVTDFSMLKILISGELDSVSCVIVDEAHERTIYTDILLGMIKQCLPKHPHLKVVITSATIDTSIFQDYFSLTDSAVLHISGRTFPVEDVWLDSDVTPDGDYFYKSIVKALQILTEDPGDVLSFLTTPLETEKAIESFHEKLKGNKAEKNVKVFCLHGKMNPEEQQKVFEKTPKGMRKVIFATNSAETSITIPGIKYVIDCGLVKESQYDAVRNMSVLSVGFVSKSSAEQRRGRAGRTQVGKCYRLYSKKNYNSMADSSKPEILRINLGQALLKLLKMGVKNPLQFDFIQSPPKELLSAAMNQLSFLSAVDENLVLTDLGKNMAALPLEPRLCHLIFQGFDNNIGYDALVTAALVTMSHSIYFRNSDNKDEADKKKKRFCESESDFLSYLEVYKEWADVPKNSKSQWCVINCINARSMRIVHELVNEIILILQKELTFKVKLKFSDESTYETLTRIIFYSFSQNLSVFSGHPRYGYKCLNVSDQLLIHPSSSLSAFGQLMPEFVVYDTILKTSQTFIVNVSPVSRETIMSVVSMHNLKINLNALESLVGTEYCICPVGEKIIFSCFIGKKGIKRKELQRTLKEFTKSDFIEIDVDVSKGCVKIFGFHLNVDEIKSFILPILHEAQQHMLNEEKDIYLYEDSPLIGVLTAGGHITDVVLPDEFRAIKVILKGHEGIEPIIEKLSNCGLITEVREWNKYYKVMFKTAASAKNAFDTYHNEPEFSLQKIHKYSSVNEKNYLYKVFMSFLRRTCTGVAFITVEPKVSSHLLSLNYEGQAVATSISKKTGDIRIVGLPANTNNKKLQLIVSDSLPSGVKITKCVLIRKTPYESIEQEMELIKKTIIELFAEFTFKEDINVSLKKPDSKDLYWNANVYFKNAQDGETAVNVLRSRRTITNFVGGFVLKPDLQTYLCCKSEIFSVVKEEIEEALQFFKKDQPAGSILNIEALPKGPDTVEVKIMSNNIRDITDARRCIYKILCGDELKLVDGTNKAKLFSNAGKELIKKLSAEFQNCYILQNDYSKSISIYGKESSCNIIKMRVNEFLNDLQHDNFKELSLKTDSNKTGVLKELLKSYGYDLQRLTEDCNASNISINKYKQILIVQGNSSSISKCESIVQNIKEKLEANCSEVIRGEMCPVCFDEVSEDKHRLQYCGHAYCTECLLHLFQNSDDVPLICEVESCQKHIVLIDIFWAINGRKPLEKVLYKKFLHSFVASRDDISFCPSPDCPMVFRVTKDKMNIFKCPACGNSICTKCEEIFHFGLACSVNKSLKSDVSLKVWMQEDPSNRKLCPSCSSPIEKNGGCNHMTCWKCNCHMCWQCLAVFPTGMEVYDHQTVCPMNHLLML